MGERERPGALPLDPARGSAPGPAQWGAEAVRARAAELGPWFHNLDLRGVRTAPDHFLFDFPAVKWASFRDHVPADLSGRTVLDIGCNGGFYSLEMKRRGAARVLAIDHDPHYLAQARFAAEVEGLEIEFRQLSVYDVGALGERFDVVLFLGVLYHLRHPLLALDPIFNCVPDAGARERLVAKFDIGLTEPEWALGYRFDVVLRGRGATPMENPGEHH